MSQTTELGIHNINGREPSVSDKLRIHRQLLSQHSFETTHRILLGDARVMRAVADESVHLVVTSPPYFDLVEYVDGRDQLGHLHDYGVFWRSSTRCGTSAVVSSSPVAVCAWWWATSAVLAGASANMR
jgi:hypothetical protein